MGIINDSCEICCKYANNSPIKKKENMINAVLSTNNNTLSCHENLLTNSSIVGKPVKSVKKNPKKKSSKYDIYMSKLVYLQRQIKKFLYKNRKFSNKNNKFNYTTRIRSKNRVSNNFDTYTNIPTNQVINVNYINVNNNISGFNERTKSYTKPTKKISKIIGNGPNRKSAISALLLGQINNKTSNIVHTEFVDYNWIDLRNKLPERRSKFTIKGSTISSDIKATKEYEQDTPKNSQQKYSYRYNSVSDAKKYDSRNNHEDEHTISENSFGNSNEVKCLAIQPFQSPKIDDDDKENIKEQKNNICKPIIKIIKSNNGKMKGDYINDLEDDYISLEEIQENENEDESESSSHNNNKNLHNNIINTNLFDSNINKSHDTNMNITKTEDKLSKSDIESEESDDSSSGDFKESPNNQNKINNNSNKIKLANPSHMQSDKKIHSNIEDIIPSIKPRKTRKSFNDFKGFIILNMTKNQDSSEFESDSKNMGNENNALRSSIFERSSLSNIRNSIFRNQRNMSISSTMTGLNISVIKTDQDFSKMKGHFLKQNKNKKFKYTGKKDKSGKKIGYGLLQWENGSTLKGKFNNSYVNGICEFVYGSSTFIGEYSENLPKGYGIFKKGKYSLQGKWDRNQLNGLGIGFWEEGDQYEGEFVDCKKSGFGSYVFPDGTTYKGMWKDDVMNGFGVIKYKNDSSYIGEFKNGNINGWGSFIFSSGNYYIGNYSNEIKHGFGIFLWSLSPINCIIGFWNKGKLRGICLKVRGKNVSVVNKKSEREEKNIRCSDVPLYFKEKSRMKYLDFFRSKSATIIETIEQYIKKGLINEINDILCSFEI